MIIIIIYLGIVGFFYLLIKKYFSKVLNFSSNEIHILFRSFFCFFISSLSLFFSITHWNQLQSNAIMPIKPTSLAFVINKLMLSYMIFDTYLYIVNKQNGPSQFRIELLFHHLVSIGLYGLFGDHSIMAFCAMGEILSAFNWIGILFPQYEWMVKLFRLYSIIFIRFFVWGFVLVFLHNHFWLYWLGLVGVIIFIALDCYWAWIIISNFVKHKKFIKEKIISNAKNFLN